MSSKDRIKAKRHWEKVIKQIERIGEKRGFNTTMERQEKYLAESKIEELYESK